MALLPASTNDSYRGAPVAAWFLTLAGVATIGPGLIHVFAPDGGAHSIAGLDLSRAGPLIVSLFAWAGATQIAWGALLLIVSLRYRALAPLCLALLLGERALQAANVWLLKPRGDGAHPPETYATLAALPVIAAMLTLSLRARR